VSDQPTACVADHGDTPRPAEDGLLCRRHSDHLRNWLVDIADWYVQHRAFVATDGGQPRDRAMAVTDPRVIGWREKPIAELPLSVATARHLNNLSGRLESNGDEIPEVPQTVASWLLVMGEEGLLATDENGNPVIPSGLIAQLDLLRTQHWLVVRQPWVDEYLRDVRDCQRALAAAVGEASGPQPFGMCPVCSTAERKVPVFTRAEEERWDARREGRTEQRWPLERAQCSGCGASWEGTAQMARLQLMQEAS
jgi:hypothetical protein